jgi:hypothetical protein
MVRSLLVRYRLTLQKVVQTAITGNLQLRSDTQSGSSFFGDNDGTNDSLIVSLNFQVISMAAESLTIVCNSLRSP